MEAPFRKITAPCGSSFLLDEEDVPLLDGMLYFIQRFNRGKRYYVRIREPGLYNKNKMVALHRVILNMKKGERVDFKNLDTLDLRRSNIRSCTYAEKNCHVRKKRQYKKFKGVFYDSRRGIYYAQIAIGHVRHWGGSYTTEEEAAAAYDILAKKFHGEFVLTNQKDDGSGQG